jgi:uncharacterized membrane protein YdjX (TVP38/TMEM64 family)
VLARFGLIIFFSAGAIVLLGLSPWTSWLRDREAVQAWLAGFGIWAPLAGILLGVAQVVGLPMPASVLGLVNGYLFGPSTGAVIGLVGGSLGAVTCIAAVRVLGRPAIARILGAEGMGWLDHYAGHPNLLYAAAVTFLIPGIPDNMIFFALGLGKRPVIPVLALALVLRLPAMVILPYVGAHLPDLLLR